MLFIFVLKSLFKLNYYHLDLLLSSDSYYTIDLISTINLMIYKYNYEIKS